MVISGLRGREYKPHFSKTVLFFKNIDLCNFDEYGTCEIMELIVQLIRRSGIYTESLEWINVTDLIVCCSMLNMQKRQFSPRFLSIVQNFYAEWVSFHVCSNHRMDFVLKYLWFQISEWCWIKFNYEESIFCDECSIQVIFRFETYRSIRWISDRIVQWGEFEFEPDIKYLNENCHSPLFL